MPHARILLKSLRALFIPIVIRLRSSSTNCAALSFACAGVTRDPFRDTSHSPILPSLLKEALANVTSPIHYQPTTMDGKFHFPFTHHVSPSTTNESIRMQLHLSSRPPSQLLSSPQPPPSRISMQNTSSPMTTSSSTHSSPRCWVCACGSEMPH